MSDVKIKPGFAGTLPERSAPLTPEKRLWLYVLLQALYDATIELPLETTTKRSKWYVSKKRAVRDQARAVIFATTSTTIGHFQMVCDLAGVPPTAFQRRVSDFIEGRAKFNRKALRRYLRGETSLADTEAADDDA